MNTIEFFVAGTVFTICGFAIGMVFGKELYRASELTIVRAGLGTLFQTRNEFLHQLDQTIDGHRYLGAGSALIMSKPLNGGTGPDGALRANDRVTQTIESLYRTGDGLDFLVLATFDFDGAKSSVSDFRIRALTPDEALDWTRLYAGKRGIARVA